MSTKDFFNEITSMRKKLISVGFKDKEISLSEIRRSGIIRIDKLDIFNDVEYAIFYDDEEVMMLRVA